MYNWEIKFLRCWGSNLGSLVSEATALPTEPPPLPVWWPLCLGSLWRHCWPKKATKAHHKLFHFMSWVVSRLSWKLFFFFLLSAFNYCFLPLIKSFVQALKNLKKTENSQEHIHQCLEFLRPSFSSSGYSSRSVIKRLIEWKSEALVIFDAKKRYWLLILAFWCRALCSSDSFLFVASYVLITYW